MEFYAHLLRHRLLRENFRRVIRGFSLLEIVLVLFVMGILAAVLLPSTRDVIERSQREAELRSLAEIAETISRSFEATDLTTLNVAALPGTIGSGDSPTVFSASTTALYSTTDSASWFAKVARLRGITPVIDAAPTAAVQPELAKIPSMRTAMPACFLPGRSRPDSSDSCS